MSGSISRLVSALIYLKTFDVASDQMGRRGGVPRAAAHKRTINGAAQKQKCRRTCSCDGVASPGSSFVASNVTEIVAEPHSTPSPENGRNGSAESQRCSPQVRFEADRMQIASCCSLPRPTARRWS
jgi:hypothetical protein